MAHKIFAFLIAALLVSTLSISSAFAADEFSPRFTNKAPIAFGDDLVNPQDLIAQQNADDDLAAELNAIMPAAGNSADVKAPAATPVQDKTQVSPDKNPVLDTTQK